MDPEELDIEDLLAGGSGKSKKRKYTGLGGAKAIDDYYAAQVAAHALQIAAAHEEQERILATQRAFGGQVRKNDFRLVQGILQLAPAAAHLVGGNEALVGLISAFLYNKDKPLSKLPGEFLARVGKKA